MYYLILILQLKYWYHNKPSAFSGWTLINIIAFMMNSSDTYTQACACKHTLLFQEMTERGGGTK